MKYYRVTDVDDIIKSGDMFGDPEFLGHPINNTLRGKQIRSVMRSLIYIWDGRTSFIWRPLPNKPTANRIFSIPLPLP